MLNRVGSLKPIETPPLPGQSADADKRPGPSPHSAHPTGPAPPFDYQDEPQQTDSPVETGEVSSGRTGGRN